MSSASQQGSPTRLHFVLNLRRVGRAYWYNLKPPPSQLSRPSLHHLASNLRWTFSLGKPGTPTFPPPQLSKVAPPQGHQVPVWGPARVRKSPGKECEVTTLGSGGRERDREQEALRHFGKGIGSERARGPRLGVGEGRRGRGGGAGVGTKSRGQGQEQGQGLAPT